MAIAKAAPSIGSVPAPNSSSNTRLLSSACSIIRIILVIWEEKVDRDCSILCSSPISTRIWRKTDTWLPSATGSINPHIAIADNKPIVFSVTVLPPVLGPVIIKVSNSFPNTISVGTTVSRLSKGCLACLNCMIPVWFNCGIVAFIEYAKSALAKMTFNWTAASYPTMISSANCPTSAESSVNIRSISSFSFDCSTRISLFASTTLIGSINKVEPLEEVSCTNPGTSPRYSAFTGTT